MNKNNKQLFLNPLHAEWVYEYGEAIKQNSWHPLDTRLMRIGYYPPNNFKKKMDLFLKENPEPKKFITDEELLKVTLTKQQVLEKTRKIAEQSKNNPHHVRFSPARLPPGVQY